jgi:hypothetical protein
MPVLHQTSIFIALVFSLSFFNNVSRRTGILPVRCVGSMCWFDVLGFVSLHPTYGRLTVNLDDTFANTPNFLY